MSEADPAAATEPLDDLSIEGDDLVFRRLSDGGQSMIAKDTVTGERRPTTGAFKPDPDGVSVFLRSVLTANDLGPEAVVTRPENLVVSLTAGDIRSIDIGIRRDPWPGDVPDPDHPRYVAHALLKGLEALSNNERHRRQGKLVMLPSLAILENLKPIGG
jgi:hypothetical protein